MNATFDQIIKNKASVVLFLKAPVIGSVKTRLASKLGDEATLDIYKHFVLKTLKMLGQTGYPVRVYFYPSREIEITQKLIGHHLQMFPQKGDNLGERMANAFTETFSEGFDKAILVGTDIPDLNPGIINDAIKSLYDYSAVIGPSTDGGYYLIGFNSRSFLPQAFEGMSWGASDVYERTIICMKDHDLSLHITAECHDVDTYEDLVEFLNRSKKAGTDYNSVLARWIK